MIRQSFFRARASVNTRNLFASTSKRCMCCLINPNKNNNNNNDDNNVIVNNINTSNSNNHDYNNNILTTNNSMKLTTNATTTTTNNQIHNNQSRSFFKFATEKYNGVFVGSEYYEIIKAGHHQLRPETCKPIDIENGGKCFFIYNFVFLKL